MKKRIGWKEALISSGDRARVLVVDDEIEVRRSLQRLITKFGYAVRVAASAEEADNWIGSERFEVCLLDIEQCPVHVRSPGERRDYQRPPYPRDRRDLRYPPNRGQEALDRASIGLFHILWGAISGIDPDQHLGGRYIGEQFHSQAI